MARGVFQHRASLIDDDRLAEQYSFKQQSLKSAKQCVGDWTVYYEPRGSGPRGYFALAKVEAVVPDLSCEGGFLAIMKAGSFLEFDRNVPFKLGATAAE